MWKILSWKGMVGGGPGVGAIRSQAAMAMPRPETTPRMHHKAATLRVGMAGLPQTVPRENGAGPTLSTDSTDWY